jgi:hypothetical protein
MIGLLLVLALASNPQQKPPKPPHLATAVRVYVWTAQPKTDTPTEDERGRLDSVRDVSDALRHDPKVTIVDSAADSQVSVEVVNREERDKGQGGFGGSELTPFRQTLVRLQVEAGSQKSELKGSGQGSWGAAAKDAAKRVLAWIADHDVDRDPDRRLNED